MWIAYEWEEGGPRLRWLLSSVLSSKPSLAAKSAGEGWDPSMKLSDARTPKEVFCSLAKIRNGQRSVLVAKLGPFEAAGWASVPIAQRCLPSCRQQAGTGDCISAKRGNKNPARKASRSRLADLFRMIGWMLKCGSRGNSPARVYNVTRACDQGARNPRPNSIIPERGKPNYRFSLESFGLGSTQAPGKGYLVPSILNFINLISNLWISVTRVKHPATNKRVYGIQSWSPNCNQSAISFNKVGQPSSRFWAVTVILTIFRR